MDIPPIQEFKDRTILLMVLGVFEILMGLFLLGMAGLALMTVFFIPTPGQNVTLTQMASALFIYVAGGMIFITLGIGSFLLKRWARNLIIVTHFLWLATGVLAVFYSLTSASMFREMMLKQMTTAKTAVPNAAMFASSMVGVMVGLFVVFGVVLPLILVLLYRSKNVKATVEFKDPVLGWTDRCPLPVLAISFIDFYAALTLFMIFGTPYIPFFGVFIFGNQARVLMVLFITLFGFLGWKTYHQKAYAWWGSLLVPCMAMVSAAITFSFGDIRELYESFGVETIQIDLILDMNMMGGTGMTLSFLCGAVAWGVFLIYCRKYFGPESHGALHTAGGPNDMPEEALQGRAEVLGQGVDDGHDEQRQESGGGEAADDGTS